MTAFSTTRSFIPLLAQVLGIIVGGILCLGVVFCMLKRYDASRRASAASEQEDVEPSLHEVELHFRKRNPVSWKEIEVGS